ncbi:nicotinamide riboside transporter PnuC [Ornithobacterium rhinotracheale]|uniref:nicotinamide riboside transporter PnuC n=1 Tax=Ornithobacterium rhinotracheale TaxID=28251 RepID=UPI001FF1F1A6|nr:nicotinamide riboside transporter PnuC [Ornithobacterium rhinotracheale]MCK0205031.1 nicotinamide riboside transporter PnuC [Ornithobacterium rhinotracheale]
MDTLYDFFLSPYAEATWQDILLEVTAVIFGLLSVLFARKGNIWVYPTGIISTMIYVYICYMVRYYGDLIINIYYTMMSVYGWILWANISEDSSLKITWCKAKDWAIALAITILSMVFVVGVYIYFDKFESWLNYVDVLTTGLAFGSMWLMAKKKVENWLGWLLTDLISVPLYFAKGLGFTGIQFTIFLILAWQGYQIWKKEANEGREKRKTI